MPTPTIPDWPSYINDDLVSDNGTDIDVAFLDELGNAIQAAITGLDNPSVYAQSIIDEVIVARGAYADLDERLDQPIVGTINDGVSASDIIDEVVAARDDNPDLNDRLDNFVADEIPDADETIRGLISEEPQILNGQKTFTTRPVIRPGSATAGEAIVGGMLFQDGAEYVNVDGTELDTTVVTLLPNTLDSDGKAIRVVAWGKTGAGADSRIIRVYFNGASLINLTTVVANGQWQLEAIIQRRTSGTQTARCRGGSVTLGLNTATIATLTNSGTVWDNLTHDITSSIILKLTIQNATDASPDVIYQTGCFVELLG